MNSDFLYVLSSHCSSQDLKKKKKKSVLGLGLHFNSPEDVVLSTEQAFCFSLN